MLAPPVPIWSFKRYGFWICCMLAMVALNFETLTATLWIGAVPALFLVCWWLADELQRRNGEPPA